MAAPYRVAVIILNYHGETVLPACLDSLLAATEAGDQVLVVDNGQETSLMKVMQKRFPEISILSLPKNGGFSTGMNAGMRAVAAQGKDFDAYWLLNNDTTVSPSALTALKRAAQEKSDRGLFSPVILDRENGPTWFAGGEINFFRMKTVHQRSILSEKMFTTDFLTGCALFIPRKTLEILGELDERYFLYAEDAEYSLRAKRMGIPRLVVPEAKIYHSEESEKNAGKLYWLVRSSAEFFLRESRGMWRLWVFFYYFLRRLKNRLRIWLSHGSLAQEVERAYTDVSL